METLAAEKISEGGRDNALYFIIQFMLKRNGHQNGKIKSFYLMKR
jgi:hypothetical protein